MQISTKMGGTFYSRDNLLKRSLPPHKSKWQHAHDDTLRNTIHDQVNTTPLIS